MQLSSKMLKEAFPDSKPTEVTDSVSKATVPSINFDQLKALAWAATIGATDCEIKRSGTGLTIIITA
jgi:hypothetical protein